MIRRSMLDRRRGFGRRIVRDRRREAAATLLERRRGVERRRTRAWGAADRRSVADRRKS